MPHIQSQSAQRYQMDMWNSGWTGRGMSEAGVMGSGQHQSTGRHQMFMQSGVPTQYRGQKNTLTATVERVQEGAKLYGQQ